MLSFQVKSSCFMPPCRSIWHNFVMSLFNNNNNLDNLIIHNAQPLLAHALCFEYVLL